MSPEQIGLLGIGVLLVTIFCGVWIGLAMAVIGLIGCAYLAGFDKATLIAGLLPLRTISSYTLSTLPTFILMGAIISNTGVAEDVYNTFYKWIGHWRGGLAMTTTVACGAFAACCGSSLATAASIGKIGFKQMEKYKYDTSLASGCVAAGGTIGILIPPSIGFIFYGLLTRVSIGRLFMAGIIPGVLEVVFYCITIFIICRVKPQMGPSGNKTGFKEKIFSLKNTWALAVLFLLVMGGIYMGIFTPTEAGAVGAFGAILITLFGRKLKWGSFQGSITEAAETSAMLFFLFIGASFFSVFLELSNIQGIIIEFITGLTISRYLILAGILFLYVILGCFLEVGACIVLTVPIIFPLIVSLGFNPIWFGVLMVRIQEVGLITPPVGLNCFVINAATGVPLSKIFRGVVPFVIADICHIALLVAIPQLSLFLPESMS
jgi:C4-dicarboxylate transporter DctM subunit